MAFDAGCAWTPVSKLTNSADASTGIDISNAPASNEILQCDDLVISVGATALTVTITEETTGATLDGPWYFPANCPPVQVTLRNGNFRTTTAGKKVRATSSAAGNITIRFNGHALPST